MTARTLVNELSFIQEIDAPGGSMQDIITLNSPWIRPRIEGYDDAVRGAARNSIYVDDATVVFDVRPYGALNVIQAELFVRRFGLLGQGGTPAFGPGGTFPPTDRDVTGEFILARGNLEVPAMFDGVVGVSLQLTNHSAAPIMLACTIQVFGEVTVRQVEQEATAKQFAELPGTFTGAG